MPSLRELWEFIKTRLLIALLGLIFTIINSLISSSPISVGLSIAFAIVFVGGGYIMFRSYKREKEIEKVAREKKFLNKLRVFLEEFKSMIGNTSYAYSLPSVAFEIANDKIIQKKTKAWNIIFSLLTQELDNQTASLEDDLKKETSFLKAFKKFEKLLFLLKRLRLHFYGMIIETKDIKDFSKEENFRQKYKRTRKEFNNYMDRLSNFSDDLKAEFNLILDRELIEHLKNLDELY